MDVKTLLTLSGSAIIAIFGWFVAHWLASLREQRNKRRDIRVSYLIEAYRNMANAALRSWEDPESKALETAVHDIQLFGTQHQNDLLNDFLDKYESSGVALLDSLLKDMRDDLRHELHIGDISGNRFRFFRWKKKNG
jgi:hypothetical protein